MKAKYKHYGNDCIIYNQIICVDNIVTEVESYTSGWFDTTPKTNTRVSLQMQKQEEFSILCVKNTKTKNMIVNIRSAINRLLTKPI